MIAGRPRNSLILASASPRRRALLTEAGFRFSIAISNVAEEDHGKRFSGRETALFNALNKARAAAMRHYDDCVVGADTVVDLNGRLLGKPINLHEAWQMLRLLSGKSHIVWTGVVIIQSGFIQAFAEGTKVTFEHLSDAEIGNYIHEVEPCDKAGGYGAQESASVQLISSIEGSLSNVYGLPIETLTPILAAKGCERSEQD